MSCEISEHLNEGLSSFGGALADPRELLCWGSARCQVVGGIPTFPFLPAGCQTLVLSVKADVFGWI